MKTAVCIIAVLVVLSVSFAEDQKDPLGIEIQLISGVMTKTPETLAVQLAEETKVLTRFSWKDQGYLDEPLFGISDKTVAHVRLRKISLSDHCSLELIVTARSPGNSRLDFSVSGHKTSIVFLVR